MALLLLGPLGQAWMVWCCPVLHDSEADGQIRTGLRSGLLVPRDGSAKNSWGVARHPDEETPYGYFAQAVAWDALPLEHCDTEA